MRDIFDFVSAKATEL